MQKKFRPLSRRITLICLLFIVLLGIALPFVTYHLYSDTMFTRYREQMTSILDYVQDSIDHDDMSRCAETFEQTETHRKTQAFFDHFVDYYSDLHFLYMIKPMPEGDPINIRVICSASTTWDKTYDADDVLHLGDGDADWYDDETAAKFREIMNGDEDVFFLNNSEWGWDYTLTRPMIDSSGKHYAVLCVDVSVDKIRSTIYRAVILNAAVVVILGVAIILTLLLWLRVRVTKPIKELEDSVVAFASISHGRQDPDELIFRAPALHANNEISSLSDSVEKMSFDMKEYVTSILAAREEVKELQEDMSHMDVVAYHDALTRVKNKASFDKIAAELDEAIAEGTAAFAIVMADLNDLKRINDQYGHDKGDAYLVGTSHLISDVFKRSPVFRIGGDEFAVILTGVDYHRRDALLSVVRQRLNASASRTEAEPWDRYSASVGMAVYRPGKDKSVDAVLKRADSKMYAAKKAFKAENNQ